MRKRFVRGTIEIALWAAMVSAPCATSRAAVSISDTTDEGQAAFKITTTNAVYYLQKNAGGFSSLVDKNGKDWIGANSSGGASGMYRGIPNLVHPGDLFHPMHEHCTCTKKSAAENKVTIECATDEKNGWAILYEFYDDRAELTVTEKGEGYEYWFLYEGTPNGDFDAETNYLYRSDTQSKHYLAHEKTGDIQPVAGENHEWIYFGDDAVERGLLLILHQDDSHGDRYYAMDPMTVFGFGRPSGTRKKLTAVPNTFSVVMLEQNSWNAIAEAARTIVDGTSTAVRRPGRACSTAARPLLMGRLTPGSVLLHMPWDGGHRVRITDMRGRLVAAATEVQKQYRVSRQAVGTGVFLAEIAGQGGTVAALFALRR